MKSFITAFTIFGALFLSAYKKKEVVNPIEITVDATGFTIILSEGRKADELSVAFTYNNARYSFRARRPILTGDDNGIATISNTNMVSANSALSKEDVAIKVSQPTIPNTITFEITGAFFTGNDFMCGTVGPTGNKMPCNSKEFKKINIRITPQTEFYVQAELWKDFSAKYASDLPALMSLVSKGAGIFNDYDPDTPGNQPFSVQIFGNKY